jgi:hypothetical protein
VAATVSRSTAAGVAGALAATGFLAAMALSGRLPAGGSLVRFEAAGVMRETPEAIDRVELVMGARRLSFARAASGQWTVAPAGSEFPASGASHLDMALQFLHVSAPLRVMARSEYADQTMAEFGLDPPRYTVTVQRHGQPMVAAFGARNPQDVAQYVRVEGRSELYLLPSFVGREWEAVVDAANGA